MLCADWSDGGAIDDVGKFHAAGIPVHLQLNRHYRKFVQVREELGGIA